MTPLSFSPERCGPRWSARIPVRFQLFDARSGDLELSRLRTALARDIGPNGLFLQAAELAVGTRIHFFFELPEMWGGCVEAFGEVVHQNPRRDLVGNLLAGVGVRVTRISARDRMRLDQYLVERQKLDAACVVAQQLRLRAEARVALRVTG